MENIDKKLIIPEKLYDSNLNGKILYIRHGQTNYNKNSNKSNLNIMKIKSEYIDCDINEKGIEQTKKISNIIEQLDIEEIYVSPLSRTLHTALILFKNHPQKDKIIIKVHPLITEVISGVHGFSFDIQNKECLYPKTGCKRCRRTRPLSPGRRARPYSGFCSSASSTRRGRTCIRR